MAQEMKQEILVDVTVKGGEAAAKTLESIDAKIKSIKQNARGLSSAMSSIGKVSNIGSMSASMGGVSAGNTAALQSSMKSVQTATSKAGAAAKQATPMFSKLKSALDASSKSAKSASWNFFRTRAAVAAVAAILGAMTVGISKWFALASDYAESSHLFYTTLASSLQDVADEEKTAAIAGKDLFGNLTGDSVKVTPAVKAAADEVERMAQVMMLDPTSLRRTYATFYEMANSAGMATDKVMKLSQGMTQLTYDLASLWDKPFDETASKLQSGISGISTAVKSYGIDISRTAADQWLMDNAIDATYNDLGRANKMIVMYNMLMEHTTTAQGDLARSALQPANMLRILGEQSRIAGRMMGAAVFPVVTKLIPLFIMLAQAVQRAAAMLSSFLGMKLGSWYTDAQKQWNSYLSNLNQSFGSGFDMGADDAEDDLGGVGDAADDTAKKLKEITDFTLPFDELHMLPDVSAAAGSGAGSGAGGGGMDMDIPILDPYDWDSDLNDIILKDAQATLDTIKKLIDDTFGTGTVDAFTGAIKSMGTIAIANFTRIKNTVGEVMGALIGLIDWPAFLWGFADGFNQVTTAAAGLVEWVGKIVTGFLELEPVKKFFKDNSYQIGKFMGVVAGAAAVVVGFNGAIKILKILFSPVAKIFKLALSPITAVAGGLMKIPGIVSSVTGAFSKAGGIIGNFIGGNSGGLRGIVAALGKIPGPVGIVITIIAGLVAAFVNLMNTDEDFRNGVLETWDRIQSSFTIVGEKIQPFLDQIKEALIRIGDAFGIVIDPASDFGDVLSQLLKPLLEALLPILENLVYFLEGAFVTAIGIVSGVISGISYIVEGFATVLSGVFTLLQGLGEFLTGVFTGDLEKVSEGFQHMSEGAGNIVSGMVEMVTGLFKGLGDIVVNILDGLGIDVGDDWDGMKEKISEVVTGIQGAVQTGFNWLANTVSGIFNNIGKFMTDPIQSAKGVITGIADTLARVFNFKWELPRIKLPHFNWSTRTFLGIQIPIFSGIDWYAKGGVFDKATVAGIGEAGPEAVVPLQGARMRPFAEAIASNIHNVNDSSYSGSKSLDGDALVAAISTSVYNAMIQGFPKKIEANMEMDGVKLNKQLDTIKRQQGVGTSLVSAV